jgi:hypothetical protein
VKRVIPLAVVALLVASMGFSYYTVLLRSGKRIVAREKYKVKGANALFTDQGGTLIAIPVSQIDLEATDKFNAAGLGGTSGIDLPGEGAPPPTQIPTPSLNALVPKLRPETVPISPDAVLPTPTPGINFRGSKFRDPRVDQVFQQGLETSHLYLYRTSQGTQPEYLFVEIRVNGEAEVMKALEAICTTYSFVAQELSKTGEGGRAPERVEIQLLSESGKEAGVFRVSAAEAADMASGKVGARKFFIDHVIY